MKDKIDEVCANLELGCIDWEEASKQLFDLFVVSGSNCCKQCKEPIEKGFRFCSGECKQYYYR
jgi:hypothetical protein